VETVLVALLALGFLRRLIMGKVVENESVVSLRQVPRRPHHALSESLVLPLPQTARLQGLLVLLLPEIALVLVLHHLRFPVILTVA